MSLVAGIDPSMTATGVVLLGDSGFQKTELIKSKKQEGNYGELERLTEIRDKACALVDNSSLVVMEGLAFMARNTSALVQLSALNYLIREQLWRWGIPFVIVAPSTLKKFATGKGNAKKDSMYLETYKRWGLSFSDDNLCDAHALARIGEALLMEDIKGLPQFQQETINLLKPQYEKPS